MNDFFESFNVLGYTGLGLGTIIEGGPGVILQCDSCTAGCFEKCSSCKSGCSSGPVKG